jgi:hypothetical protein
VVSQLCMLLSSNHSKKWCGCVTSKDSLVVKPEGTASLIPKPYVHDYFCAGTRQKTVPSFLRMTQARTVFQNLFS